MTDPFRPDADHAAGKQVAVDLTSDFDLTAHFKDGYAKSLYVGTSGNVYAQMVGDSAPVLRKNVAAGEYLDGCWTLVKATSAGTTAADIVAEGD